jgi:hypothetical protein
MNYSPKWVLFVRISGNCNNAASDKLQQARAGLAHFVDSSLTRQGVARPCHCVGSSLGGPTPRSRAPSPQY